MSPAHFQSQLQQAVTHHRAGRLQEAAVVYRRLMPAAPRHFDVWNLAGLVAYQQHRLDDAIKWLSKAHALNPGHAGWWYNFGLTLSFVGRSAEALACHERALAAEAKFASGHFGRGQALLELHRVDESIAAFDAGLALEPGRHEARSHRLLALHALDGISREDLLAEHIAYGRAVGRPSARTWAHSTEPERRLKVAILSPDLREHSCAYFIEPLLRHLDRDAFELYLYHDHFREDETTARLRTLASVWRNFAAQPGDTVETVIRADAPDILIDLAGHTGTASEYRR
ncbi:MAG: hypothetical protein CFE26_26785, partial [Verrucomicrobiales bacterium VVV1]